jgi:hypothetical protein
MAKPKPKPTQTSQKERRRFNPAEMDPGPRQAPGQSTAEGRPSITKK